MQRYLSSGYGYKYFSSPFTSATVSQFSNEVNLSASFPPVYEYDESLPSNGWYHYSSSSDALSPLFGYAVNFGSSSSPLTVDMTGVVSNGIQLLALFNTNQTYTQGFNLVGNPYPSPIDWNASSGWTKTNIDNAIYFFDASTTDQYSGSYSSYINGVSSNGIASNVIPAMQGFFVHVSNSIIYPVIGALGVNNNVRVNNLTPTFHKTTGNTDPTIRISMKYASESVLSDNMVIYFDNDATLNFDKGYDALKLNNTDTRVPNLYTISPDNKALSINAMPDITDSATVIPLGIETAKDGPLVISMQDVQNFPSGLKAYIIDRQTMQYQDIIDAKTYTLNLQSGVSKNRFALVFTRKDIKDTRLIQEEINAYFTEHNIHVWLNLSTGDKGMFKLYNMAGQLVYQTELNGYGEHIINAPYSNGIYIMNFISDSKQHSKKLFIGND